EPLAAYFGPVRSVLDVPFSHGTLAVNSPAPNAFSARDVEALQALAEVLSAGFGRLDDLEALAAKEAQLRQALKMEAVGRLAGGVAHDFNNLLTVINGYCQMLVRDLDPQDRHYQRVQEIRRSGERAAGVVRQLLAFSRRQVLEPKVIDLNAVVREMDRMLRRIIGEDIALQTVTAGDLGRTLADPGQVEQVLMNLVVNVRDAMPGGGRLTLETANAELDAAYAATHPEVYPGPYVMLAVTDTGVGMDAATRERIFEPFFTTKEEGKGTGLGLSVVYGIVRQSGGHIYVYSEPGEGTTFKVYLPRVEGEAVPPGERPAEGDDLRGTETVLVAEDDAGVRFLVEQVLRECGYTVLAAASGPEALARSEGQVGPVHLLLTDIVMPGMRGPDLAARLRQRHPGLRVLYMSGYAERAVDASVLAQEGCALISKPFTPSALARRVRALLDGERPDSRASDAADGLADTAPGGA
ncbi:MAG: ATP-binding protein, partial [Candidatus Latescibacterota bacterium]